MAAAPNGGGAQVVDTAPPLPPHPDASANAAARERASRGGRGFARIAAYMTNHGDAILYNDDRDDTARPGEPYVSPNAPRGITSACRAAVRLGPGLLRAVQRWIYRARRRGPYAGGDTRRPGVRRRLRRPGRPGRGVRRNRRRKVLPPGGCGVSARVRAVLPRVRGPRAVHPVSGVRIALYAVRAVRRVGFGASSLDTCLVCGVRGSPCHIVSHGSGYRPRFKSRSWCWRWTASIWYWMWQHLPCQALTSLRHEPNRTAASIRRLFGRNWPNEPFYIVV